jgi:spermidine synthase/MFS family permease
MLHAATIFVSSFLLFLVQPLIARVILPCFGGSAAVWTTCMLFFQVLLLAGYGYAHWLEGRFLRGKLRAVIHLVLLAAAVALLPIAPAETWKPAGTEDPALRILLLLGATVGLPYFLLAFTSPLVQAWFSRAYPGRDPYRLFALSNFASLAALVGYPFVFEPFFGVHTQVVGWSWLFGVFALLCGALAWRSAVPAATVEESTAHKEKLAPRVIAMWLALAAVPSVLLLAVTNHLTQNIAAVPLLWLAPLTLYLLTFIVAFSGGAWYRPEIGWPLLLMLLGGMTWALVDNKVHFNMPVQFGLFLPGLFVACLFCHAELYRMRPAPQRLTAFYLTVSAGGALGGLFAALVAPVVFAGYYELGVALVGTAVLAAIRFSGLRPAVRLCSLLILLGVTGGVVYDVVRLHDDMRVASRSFYGVLRVKEYYVGEDSHVRRLVHGAIMHGEQYMAEGHRQTLTTYYQETSGVGAAILSKQADEKPVRVGVVGLGTGTIAGYGRPGDVFRFYDIDPRVIDIAQREFTFLSDSKARVETVVGDARLQLEREPPQQFDVLAVDAFSSDAIPVHLITKEALAVYLRHVKPDGIVAFHVSNRFLRLVPVVSRIAAENGAHVVHVEDDPDEDDGFRSRTDWVLVSRDKKALEHDEIAERGGKPPEERPEWRTWTDDYSNLVQILK